MQLSKIVLGLIASATAVSAIDAYCHFSGNCGGGSGVCAGLNPNVCCACSSGEIFPSVAFRGIPTNWQIEGRGHGGGNCRTLKEVKSNNGANHICLTARPNYSGAGYGFLARKRAVDSCSLDQAADGSACTSYVKMDRLELTDGAKYNLTALHGDDGQYNEILAIAQSAASAADIPAEFDAIKFD